MMLSRVADNLFWTARYLERAADTVHLLDISYILDLDRQEGSQPQWEPLAWITGDIGLFRSLYGEATRDNVMHFLVIDDTYANSVSSCLGRARENAKGLREQIPQALWEEINRQWLDGEQFRSEQEFSPTRILRFCRDTHRNHTLILGLVNETMARGSAYHFWQLGTYLERADKISRVLHVKYFHLLPRLSDVGTIVDDAHWEALLQSLHAREDYHRLHGMVAPDKVIEFIVRCPVFSRSILFCLRNAEESLRSLPNLAAQLALSRIERLCARIEETSGAAIIAVGVHEFINQLQIEMNQVGEAITQSIFPPCPAGWSRLPAAEVVQ